MSLTTTQIRHRTDCTDPGPTRVARGRRGDLLQICIACGRFVVQATPQAAPQVVRPKRQPKAYVSPWRCREHEDQTVNWRGTGCRSCEQEARERAVKRAAKKRKGRATHVRHWNIV